MFLIYTFLLWFIFPIQLCNQQKMKIKMAKNCEKLGYADISESHRAVVPKHRDADQQYYWYRAH